MKIQLVRENKVLEAVYFTEDTNTNLLTKKLAAFNYSLITVTSDNEQEFRIINDADRFGKSFDLVFNMYVIFIEYNEINVISNKEFLEHYIKADLL